MLIEYTSKVIYDGGVFTPEHVKRFLTVDLL